MRISDHRYQRDRQRLDVAVQFIEHEARTQTIRQWTGLTDDRIRKLYRSYLVEHQGRLLPRHRGKSPQQVAHFTRTARLRQESAVLASLCLLADVLGSNRPAPPAARGLCTVQRAQQLCQAYDAYRSLVHRPAISFEHAVFLVTALSRGDELQLAHCGGCGALLVADRLSLRVPRCAGCAGTGRLPAAHAPAHPAAIAVAEPGQAAQRKAATRKSPPGES